VAAIDRSEGGAQAGLVLLAVAVVGALLLSPKVIDRFEEG
jgi:hypothetical protein